jgi:hypothetical protein
MTSPSPSPITVLSADTTAPAPATDVASARPAAPSSPLAGLRAKRAEALAKLHHDLQVPRWSDDGGIEIWVRYAPVSPTTISAVVTARRKSKAKDWMVAANADVLAIACLGVYAVDPTSPDTKLSLRDGDPHGDWTKFDADLAYSLGLDGISSVEDAKALTAATVVRGLYLTEGDLTSAANALTTWSGIEVPRDDDDFLG